MYPVTIELHDVYADFFIVDSKTGDVYKIEAEGLERQYHDLFYIGYRMVDGGLISVEISGLKFDPVTE